MALLIRATVVALVLFVLLSAGCGGDDAYSNATVTTPQGFVIHDCLHCAARAK